MKKVTGFLLFFLGLVSLVAQGSVHRINEKAGDVASIVVFVLLSLVAGGLLVYGVLRLVKRRRAAYHYSSN
jgi:uncharacterized membrane protein (DUF2068 family)